MRLLDLFCGAGGAAEGYRQAGFDVSGVDLSAFPRFRGRFHQADALSVLEEVALSPFIRGQFDAIHASPPCQRWSVMSRDRDKTAERHPDLIAPVREYLEAIGLPYVIENVPEAPLRRDVLLCGSMFPELTTTDGLGVLRRHRAFEIGGGWPVPAQPECRHPAPGSGVQTVGVYGHAGGRSTRDGLSFRGTEAWRQVMGIDWMTGDELAEAIPPAYTRYLSSTLRGNTGKSGS